jgi:hypothetical protein
MNPMVVLLATYNSYLVGQNIRQSLASKCVVALEERVPFELN